MKNALLLELTKRNVLKITASLMRSVSTNICNNTSIFERSMKLATNVTDQMVRPSVYFFYILYIIIYVY